MSVYYILQARMLHRAGCGEIRGSLTFRCDSSAPWARRLLENTVGTYRFVASAGDFLLALQYCSSILFFMRALHAQAVKGNADVHRSINPQYKTKTASSIERIMLFAP